MVESIQPVEVLWTLIAVVGLVFSIWNVVDSSIDLHDARQLSDGLRRAAIETAKVANRTELIRGVQLFLLVFVGVLAMTIPPDETAGVLHPDQRAGIVAIFIVFAGLLTTNTVLSFVGRRAILEALENVQAELSRGTAPADRSSR